MKQKGQKKQNKAITSIYHKELKNEEQRQRNLIKNVVYPFLLEHATSIEDAKNMLYALDMGVQGAFHLKVSEEQKRISKDKLSTLNLDDIIETGKEFDVHRELLSFFKDETIATAHSLIEGLKTTIEGFQREESTKRELSTLQTDFL